MKINTKVELGIVALTDIAVHSENGESVRSSDIADRQNISQKYLEQILLGLRQGKFVKAQKGIHGGYQLSRPADRIMLCDILNTLDNNILANDSNADIAAAAIVLLVFGIIAGVLAIVSVIIKFIGIFNASRDERAFKSVIYLTLINLGVAILAACFSGIPFFNNLSNIVTDLVEFIVSLLIILGIGKLALQLNNPEIIQKCGTLFRLILWIGLLSLFMRFFSIFLPSQAAYVIILILSILSIVLSVVQYILYLSLLVKAKKMLEG